MRWSQSLKTVLLADERWTWVISFLISKCPSKACKEMEVDSLSQASDKRVESTTVNWTTNLTSWTVTLALITPLIWCLTGSRTRIRAHSCPLRPRASVWCLWINDRIWKTIKSFRLRNYKKTIRIVTTFQTCPSLAQLDLTKTLLTARAAPSADWAQTDSRLTTLGVRISVAWTS